MLTEKTLKNRSLKKFLLRTGSQNYCIFMSLNSFYVNVFKHFLIIIFK